MTDFFKKNKWPLFLFSLAVIIRIIYILELSHHPGFNVPMVDEKWHWLWAHDILEKSFWGHTAYFRAPLYPYFLAFLAAITKSSILWSKILQIFLCGGTAYFLYKLADSLFNKSTAILTTLIYAFYGTLIFYETMFLIPVVFLFFLVWGIYRLVAYQKSRSLKTWLFTGFIFGLAAISRPNILLVIPFFMLWLFFIIKESRTFFERIKLPLILFVGVFLAILPVTVRNAIITGEFTLISSQGGINLYLGNNPIATGLTMLMPETNLDISVSWRQFGKVTKAVADREAGKKLTDAQESAFWTAKAIKFIKNNPRKFLSLIWQKTVYLLSGFENSDNADIYYQMTKSTLFSFLVWHKLIYFPFGLLLPLTFVGIYLKRNDFNKLLPVYIFILAYIPSIVLFLVTARHRLPLIPFMIMIASAGIVMLVKGEKQLRTKQIIISLIIFIISLLIFNRTYYNEGKGSGYQIHYNNGIKYEQLKDYVKAEKEYELAAQLNPLSPTLLNNLAHVQYLLKKYEQADKNYHRALKLKPNFSRAYNNLGLLVATKGNLDSALKLYQKAVTTFNPEKYSSNELSEIYLNLADAYDQTQHFDSADIYYRKALKAGKQYYQAYFDAAAFYARQGNYKLTDSLYAAGMHLHDLPASAFFNWGLSLLQRKQFAGGVGMMFRALKRDDSLYQAYYCIAVGYYQQNYPVDSVKKYLDLCFRYNPNYKPALELNKTLMKNK